ncbi:MULTISPECIES: ABC transporter substrate-binding protein [Hyphomicrobiales]|uniref:ABC transporter substrate-binding protein n=2 Tax=Prosthecodimorpha TaxID=2981530 RepID=A0A0P6VGQ2_9HYPH|nr:MULTISPECIES: ABC transporter substrate-binding protein [Hyphomicrobiales]KPL51203.1 ABC transporter substrate-binding protein [Prosthecomicrobium hirschii]MBT9291620.1 ABC transporter substrate-binding protein [Prosthecodimorpha staleyi]MCW1838936.1 ABC transporter substrate-binding protein [Prosthecomicrobium hirschii]TPQ49701.1 ABC transporter substrate-binding protein [Prosthecomicrobium hirschii]
MCDRDGTFYRNFSRRGFLKSTAAGAATVALPASLASMLMPQPAFAATTVKATHGSGFCNMGIFLAKERGLTKADGVDLEFVVTPSNTEITTMFGAGLVDISMIPYSNFMTLYDAGAPVKIVAGGGVQGCIIVAKEGIKSAADLKGKTFGTFQADTLEVLPYDYLKKAGLSFKDVQIKYLDTSPELAQAFIAGAIDAICHIEPYATQCVIGRKGATVLSDGTDLYGKGYSDCVLAVRTPLIEKNPAAVKAVIKALMVAQSQAESDKTAALKDTVGKYYKTSMEAAMDASTKQPIVVDQRNQTQFIIDRGLSMQELGYVKKSPDKGAFDWSLLEAVIAENKPLYDGLKLKSA